MDEIAQADFRREMDRCFDEEEAARRRSVSASSRRPYAAVQAARLAGKARAQRDFSDWLAFIPGAEERSVIRTLKEQAKDGFTDLRPVLPALHPPVQSDLGVYRLLRKIFDEQTRFDP